MTLTHIGHSGFALSCSEVTIIFDYYTDPAGVIDSILSQARQVYVVVSHSHRDHLCHDIFSWVNRYNIERYIIANECRRKLMRSLDFTALPITFIRHDEDYSDGNLNIHAFDSTDAGLCYLLDINNFRIFHAGDFTCWHFSDDLPPGAVKKAMGDFHAILSRINAYTPHINVAMMPVVPNIGGDWAYGPRKFLHDIRVDTFIPMHTWGRDREATQWHLYQNPDYGQCVFLADGQSLKL